MITLILIGGIFLGLMLANIKPLLYNREIIEEGIETWKRRSKRTGEFFEYNRNFIKYKSTFRLNKSYIYITKQYIDSQL